MWWGIIKSSRNEAYSKFLEEFGPGVDLKSLESREVGKKTMDLIGGDWTITLIGNELYISSRKYDEYRTFVKGIFQEEYPERYKEIEDLLVELISAKRDREGIITSSEELPFYAVAGIEIWLKKHMIFLDNRPPTRNQKLAILNNIIGYYEKKNGFSYAEEDKLLELYDTREQFENTNNLWDLFQKYQEVMHRHAHVIVAREIIKTKGQMITLRLLLDGKIPMPSYNGIEKKLTIERVD